MTTGQKGLITYRGELEHDVDDDGCARDSDDDELQMIDDDECEFCGRYPPLDDLWDVGIGWDADHWRCKNDSYVPVFCEAKFKKLVRHDLLGWRIDPYFGLNTWEPERLRCLALGRLWAKPGPWLVTAPRFSDRKIVSFGS